MTSIAMMSDEKVWLSFQLFQSLFCPITGPIIHNMNQEIRCLGGESLKPFLDNLNNGFLLIVNRNDYG